MRLKKLLLIMVMIVALAGCLACQGCTIKFKATDVELDSVAMVVYEFDGIELTDGQSN